MTDKERLVYDQHSEWLRDDTLALARHYAEQLARKLRAAEAEGATECDLAEALELAHPIVPLLETIY